MKTYCSGDRGGMEKKHSSNPQRGKRLPAESTAASEGVVGEHKGQKPKNLVHVEDRLNQNTGGILSSSSPLSTKLRPLSDR